MKKSINKVYFFIVLCAALVSLFSGCNRMNNDEGQGSEKEGVNTKEKADGIVDVLYEASDFAEKTSINSNKKNIEEADIGDVVEFGVYEIDGESEEKENILWDVIDEKDGNLLLISHYVIDQVAFTTGKSNPGWGKSYVRVWLNNDFYSEAFNEDEKNRIILTDVDNPSSVEMFEMRGEMAIDREFDDTQDYVFLLSWKETFEYYDVGLVQNNDEDAKGSQKEELFYSNKLVAKPSPYCAEKIYEKQVEYCEEVGKDTSQVSYPRTAGWLLRSDAQIQLNNMRVTENGVIIGVAPNNEYGVRPAMWVKKTDDD